MRCHSPFIAKDFTSRKGTGKDLGTKIDIFSDGQYKENTKKVLPWANT